MFTLIIDLQAKLNALQVSGLILMFYVQILAWLMRNVSLPSALHDLLWWYASTLECKEDEYETSVGKV